MITAVLLDLIYLVLLLITAPLRLLPDASLPAVFAGNIATISAYTAAIGQIMPYSIQGLLAALGGIIGIELGIFAYKGVMWLIHRIPAQGGGSPG